MPELTPDQWDKLPGYLKAPVRYWVRVGATSVAQPVAYEFRGEVPLIHLTLALNALDLNRQLHMDGREEVSPAQEG